MASPWRPRRNCSPKHALIKRFEWASSSLAVPRSSLSLSARSIVLCRWFGWCLFCSDCSCPLAYCCFSSVSVSVPPIQTLSVPLNSEEKKSKDQHWRQRRYRLLLLLPLVTHASRERRGVKSAERNEWICVRMGVRVFVCLFRDLPPDSFDVKPELSQIANGWIAHSFARWFVDR